ncbi:MAG: tyrosine--tRNA ligase [Actinomycetota bacterium]
MSTDPRLLDDLDARGLIQDTTDRSALADRLNEGPVTVYYGVDPTAPSLHVGNLIGLLTLRRFQEAGHKPLPLAGGATGMIGDPSGKSAERNLQSDDQLAENLAGIVPLLRQFIDFERDGNPGKLLDNRAWTVSTSLLEFLRDVGKYVTVNHMVAKESVRNRMEGDDGISFTEFTYMLLQANDFLWLYENEGCEMQIGGSDQWGNISLGVDLIRRRTASKAHALTWPLLLQKDGTKYGKTAGGDTIWLGSQLMSPYRFYQAWIQTEDDELQKLLLWLTFRSVAEIDAIVANHNEAPHKRVGQRLLANDLTALIHGEDAAASAVEASEAVFGGPVADLRSTTFEMLAGELPTTTIDRARLDEAENLIPLLVDAGAASSKSEAARLLKQNGIAVNDHKVAADAVIDRSSLHHDRFCLVRKGKKSMYLLDFAASERD